MFLPLIISLISILVFTNISSAYSFKISSYIQNNNKIDKIKVLHNQESIVKDAIDSYCINNLELCVDSNLSKLIIISKENIIDYMPKNTDLSLVDSRAFSSLSIDINNSEIIIEHSFNNNIKKKYSISHELEIFFIDKKDMQIRNKIEIEANAENSDLNIVSALLNELNNLRKRRYVLMQQV